MVSPDSHRFFTQDMLSRIQRADGDLMVRKVGNGDDNCIANIRGHQILPILKIPDAHCFNLPLAGLVSGTDGCQHTIIGLWNCRHSRKGCAGENGGIEFSLLTEAYQSDSDHTMLLLILRLLLL